MKKLLFVILISFSSTTAFAEKQHAFATWGNPKYNKDYQHFDYANPNAPKGGKIILSAIGSFDSFHPFIVKGRGAAGIGNIYETLTTSASDDPSTSYGALAESFEIADDNSHMIFHLHDHATFHDGHPIDAEDVAWTFDQLMTHGSPSYQYYYGDVEKTDIIAPKSIKFHFKNKNNSELPLILGQLPVLPKHYWTSDGRDFSKVTLEPPLGSGAYKIKDFANGRFVTYERVSDYWGKESPHNRGFDNYDEIRFDYYRDLEIAREAFKAGAFDIWNEFQSKSWATAFDIPSREKGDLILKEFPHKRVAPMQAIIFNLRQKKFQNIRVRQALAYAFDFEFLNKSIMHNVYTRTDSFFDNHILSSSDHLPSDDEIKLLATFKDKIPKEVFTKNYRPPISDGSGQNRQNLRQAAILLKQAGWSVKDGILTNNNDGTEFRFEILIRQQSLEALLLHFVQSLKKLGIIANIRRVDTAQYQKKLEKFDFDSTTLVIAQSNSPGNEQREYWGSAAADRHGSRNIMGIKNPVIDSVIEKLIMSETYDKLITHTRALDRILLWNHYMIPMYFSSSDRVAYWNRFGMTNIIPNNGVVIGSWWIDINKDNHIQTLR